MSQIDNEAFLKKFNKAIEKVAKEIEHDTYMRNEQFSKFIMEAMDIICKNMQYQKETSNKKIVVIKEEEMFKVILDFFKSMDIELYNKAYKILKNKYPKTKRYIYDFHKDDPEHLTHYCVAYNNGEAKIFIPLRYSITEEEAEEINLKYGEDFYTINDLYSTTHEISHLFDIKPENYTDKPSRTRDVLCEVTPGIFELFLSEYLLKNRIFDQNIIEGKKISDNNKSLDHANLCRLKLHFLELKIRNGEITDEDIQLMMKEDILSNEEFVNIINLIVNAETTVIEDKRYAFCAMAAPIIFQKCEMNSDKELLKKYLNECSQNIPFTDILNGFGIDLRKEIDKKHKNEDYIQK